MEKRILENIIQETKDTPETGSKFSFEIESSHAQKIASELTILQDAMLYDKPVTEEVLQDLSTSINKNSVILNGNEITVEEMAHNPEYKRNLEIWEEVRHGSMENIHELTIVIDEIA